MVRLQSLNEKDFGGFEVGKKYAFTRGVGTYKGSTETGIYFEFDGDYSYIPSCVYKGLVGFDKGLTTRDSVEVIEQ